MTYTVAFRPVSSGYICKMSDRDDAGGGGFTSYLVEIHKDGEHFIDAATYVEKLSPYNNSFQNARIRSQSGRLIVDHDHEFSEADIGIKARTILEALRNNETNEASS